MEEKKTKNETTPFHHYRLPMEALLWKYQSLVIILNCIYETVNHNIHCIFVHTTLTVCEWLKMCHVSSGPRTHNTYLFLTICFSWRRRLGACGECYRLFSFCISLTVSQLFNTNKILWFFIMKWGWKICDRTVKPIAHDKCTESDGYSKSNANICFRKKQKKKSFILSAA